MRYVGNLQVSTPSDTEIAVSRVFNAPRHLVYDALTQPALIRQWLSGPPGWSMTRCEMDARVGGAYRYEWSGPDGVRMGMGGVCQIVEPPVRIVATEQFDESWYEGGAISTQQLEEANGKTTLTILVRYDSQAIRDAVLQTPMAEGMNYGYDNLAALLEQLAVEVAK